MEFTPQSGSKNKKRSERAFLKPVMTVTDYALFFKQ